MRRGVVSEARSLRSSLHERAAIPRRGRRRRRRRPRLGDCVPPRRPRSRRPPTRARRRSRRRPRARAPASCARSGRAARRRRSSGYSTDFYTRFREETGFEVDLHLVGGVRVALTRAWLDELRLRPRPGARSASRWTSSRATRSASDCPASSSRARSAGLFTRLEGYMTATREAAIGLARGAERRGATLRTYEEVDPTSGRPPAPGR